MVIIDVRLLLEYAINGQVHDHTRLADAVTDGVIVPVYLLPDLTKAIYHYHQHIIMTRGAKCGDSTRPQGTKLKKILHERTADTLSKLFRTKSIHLDGFDRSILLSMVIPYYRKNLVSFSQSMLAWDASDGSEVLTASKALYVSVCNSLDVKSANRVTLVSRMDNEFPNTIALTSHAEGDCND